MEPSAKTVLRVAIIGFFATFAVGWLAVFLGPLYLKSWAPVFVLGLVVAVLSGLFAWLWALISQLSFRVAKLTLEVEKLKKKQ